MAEGIDLPINMPGVEQVQQAVVAFDKLTSTLTAARGSGKALEELRKLLVGLKGKSSALDDLSSSIKQMSEASAAMSRSMKTGFSNLNSVIQTEMSKLAATIQANSSNLGNVMGQGLGASATASVSTAMDGVEQVVKVRGRTLSAKMRAEATAAYEASISQFSKAGIRMPIQDVMGFKDKGANLIPEHKKQLADFKKLNDEKAAVIAAGSKKIIDAEKVAAATLIQQKQKAFDALVALEKRQTDARLRSIQNSVAVAQASPVGAYMPINAQGVTSGKVVTPKQPAVSPIPPNFNPIVDDSIKKTNIFTKALGALGFEANNTHSFIRGLASGFGALWLTWGKVGPMMAGAASSMAVVKSFNVGSEFESMITMADNIGMSTDGAGQKIVNFRKIAEAELLALNKGSVYSLNELTQAFVELGRAGLDGAAALEVLKPASDLALVGATTLENATHMIMQTKNLFDLQWSDAGTIAAKLEKAANAYPLSVKDIGEALNYATDANIRFDQSLETTLVVLGQLSKAGISGTKAGVAYNNWLMDLYGRTNASRKMLKGLEKQAQTNIKLFDDFGKHRDAISVWEDLAAAIEKVRKTNPAEAAKFQQGLMTVRGNRAYSSMSKTGADAARAERERLQSVTTGELHSKALEQMKTAESSLKIFKSFLENMLTEVFLSNRDRFIAFFQGLIQIIDSPAFKSAVMSMVSLTMTLITGLMQAVPYVLQLGKALLVVGTAFAVFKGLTVFAGAVASVAALNVSVYGLIGAVATAKGVFASFTATLMANPFIALATAITAVVAALYIYRNDIKLSENSIASLGDYFSEMGKTASGVFDMIIGKSSEAEIALNNLSNTTQSSIVDQLSWWEKLFIYIGFMFDGVVGIVKEIGNALAAVTAMVDTAVKGVVETVTGFLSATGTAIQQIASGEFAAAGATMWNSLTDGAAKTTEKIKAIASGLGQTFGQEFKRQNDAGSGATVASWSENARTMQRESSRFDPSTGKTVPVSGADGETEQAKQKADFLRGLQERATVQEKLNNQQLLQRELASGTLKLTKEELAQAQKWAAQADANEAKKTGAKKGAAERATAEQRYLVSLDNQLSKVRELSAQEKLINDIKEQGLKFSPQQLAQATELAKKIDDRVRQEQEIKDLLEQQTAERARQKAQEQFEFDVKMTDATLGMGPKQAEEFKRSAKVGFTFDQAKADAELKYEQQLYQLQKGTLDLHAGETQAQALERLTFARADDLRAAQNAYTQAMLNEQTLADQQLANEQNWMAGVQSALSSYAKQANDYYTQVANIAGNALNSLQEKLVDFFKTGTFDFRGLIQGIASDIISMLVKMAINALIVQKILGAVGAANQAQSAIATTQSVVEGNLVTDAWGPAAVAVSLATMGSNAFGATAGIMAAGLAGMMFGFASGGYTGPGGVYQPAGIVHKGEGVLSQRDMAALGGPDAFERFRASLHTGFALGGVGGSTPAPVIRNYGSSSKSDTGLTVNIIEDAGKAGQVERRETEQGEDIDVFVANAIYRGGQTATALESTYGVNRVGR
jgi:TP901 family phage tail tape measure protein/lambda family phage tail tape measure protein